jgi:hypothetical protein
MSSEPSKVKVALIYFDGPEVTLQVAEDTRLGRLRRTINENFCPGTHFETMWVVFEIEGARYIHFGKPNKTIDQLMLKQIKFGNPDNNEVRVGVSGIRFEAFEADVVDEIDTSTRPAEKRTKG